MAPTVPRALVDWAGYQMLNPDKNAWIYRELREWLGGSPDATQSDFDGLTSNGFDLRLRIDDFEPSQGTGYVRTYFEQIFAFWTSPMEYTYTDYPRITPPMLMMFGDRDHGCRLAEAYELFQQLPQGEFAIIPGMPYQLSRVGCLVALDYLQHHCDYSQDSTR